MPENPLDEQDFTLSADSRTNLGPRPLDKNQKVAVAVLALVGVLVFSLWIIDTKKTFSPKKFSDGTAQDETCPNGNCNKGDTTYSRDQDTDKDGLSDYDEYHIYGTSPYLEDTDSDGYSDKVEVQNNNDPSCPSGMTCAEEASANPQMDTESMIDASVAPGASYGTGYTPSAQETQAIVESSQSILGGSGDAQSLRALLLQSGMDKETLDSISDEELMASYNDVLGGQ